MQNSSGRKRSGNRNRFFPTVIAGVLALLVLVACGSGSKNAPQPTTGTVAVTVSGLPAGQAADVSVTGPEGFSADLSAAGKLKDLSPGVYRVEAAAVASATAAYRVASVTPAQVTVEPGKESLVAVTYELIPLPSVGSMNVEVTGLPADVDAGITVTGPSSYSTAVTGSKTLEGLEPGVYVVGALNVERGADVWRANPASQSVTVEPDKESIVAVTYELVPPLSAGSMNVEVTGLPGGVDADVTVTGPSGYSMDLTGTTTLAGLEPGLYAVEAVNVVRGADAWLANPASQSVRVNADATADVVVTYTPEAVVDLGSLEVIVNGLPTGSLASVRVTGPGGYARNVTASTMLGALKPGEYQVTASHVAGFMVDSRATETVDVTAGDVQVAEFTYVAEPAITVTGTDLTLSLGQEREVTFTLTRPAGFAGPVNLDLVLPADVTARPASLTFAPGINFASVMVEDTGAAIGSHELTYGAQVADCSVCAVVGGKLSVTVGAFVTTAEDLDTPGGLRYLVAEERARAQVITFRPEAFEAGVVSLMLTEPLVLAQEIVIRGPADWDAASGPDVILDGGNGFTPLIIGETASVRIENLHVRNGLAAAGAASEDGGGIIVRAGSSLELDASHVTSNEAFRNGGGISNGGTLTVTGESLIADNEAVGRGGGIWNSGTLTVMGDSLIADNKSGSLGGGVGASGAGSVTVIERSVIRDNNAVQRGGGLFLGIGTLEVRDDTQVIGNHASIGGGIFAGIQPNAPDPGATLEISESAISDNTAGDGAGIYSYANAVVADSVIQRNAASGTGGGIRNHRVMTITGSQVRANTAGGRYGGVFNDGYVEMSSSMIEDNTAGGDGGGIFNGYYASDTLPDGQTKEMVIDTSTIRNNDSGRDGGGIHSIRRLSITDSDVSGNEADGDGGGIYSVSIAETGAPANNGGELEVISSLISGNVAGGSGGGLYSATISGVPNAPLTILNSTITGNSAQSGGGATVNGDNSGEVRLFFNTIVGNAADGVGGQGGGLNIHRSLVTIQGNLIVQNTSVFGGVTRDLFPGAGQVTSGGNNFIAVAPQHVTALMSDRFGGLETTVNVLQLGLLADNGGPTRTIALPGTSSAAKHVTVAGCRDSDGQPLTVDQRGQPRPVAGRCSVGAYQWQP